MKTPILQDADSKSILSSDRPISEAKADRLGRQGFARTIANAVKAWRGRDSLVVALYGPWGSGKSSVKNMVVESLSAGKEQSAVVIDFNPWQLAGRSQIAEIFFDEVGIALGAGDVASQETRKTLVAKWRRYAARLRATGDLAKIMVRPLQLALFLLGLTLIIRWISLPAVSTVLGCLLLLSSMVMFISRVADNVIAFLDVGVGVGKKSLAEVKRDLAISLQSLSKPMLVVIDDIDRLVPADLQEVFRLVKANADLPNLVYLLLGDRTVIERHIQEVMKVNGHDYLEKIVQVPFDIPIVDRKRVHEILFEGLNRLLSGAAVSKQFDQHRWGNVFVGGLAEYFLTLRQVHRFLSTFSFHVSLLSSEGTLEVNPVDLIALEVLRVFEPIVYQSIPTNQKPLTATSEYEMGMPREAAKQAILGLIDLAAEDRRSAVREIIKRLFPPAEWALGGMNYGYGFADTWFRELRVCSQDVFNRYFELAVGQGDLSQAAIDRILAVTGDRDRLRSELVSLHGQGLLEVAMDRFEAYKETVPLTDAGPFVTALFDVGDLLSDKSLGFVISPMMHADRIIYWFLKREPDPVRRATLIKAAIDETTGLALPVFFVSAQEKGAERRPEDERLVTDNDLPTLCAGCFQKVAAAAMSGDLASNPDLSSLLFRWRDWDSVAAPSAYCTSLIGSASGLLVLLRSFVRQSISQAMGDRVGRVRRYIKMSELCGFITADALVAEVNKIDVAILSDEDRELLVLFAKAVKRQAAGKSDDSPFRADED